MRHLHAGLAIPTFPLTPEGTLMPKTHHLFVDLAFTHRFWAVVVAALMIFVVARVVAFARRAGGDPGCLVLPSLVLAGLVSIQIFLGAEVIWLARAPIPTTLHVTNGAAILAASFILAVRGSRLARFVAEKSPDRPPGRPISA
jgi:cytochrome c oxidase assembly protein subunit 15